MGNTKINWKLRLKNKATLITLATSLITFVYIVLGALGVAPRVSEDNITQIVLAIINAIFTFGIIVDPTTSGVGDSTQALTYEEPKED